MRRLSCVALLTLLLVAGRVVAAQETQRQDTQRWKWLHANEVRTPFTTIRIGAAILPEIAGYNQDDGSREQLATLSGDTALGPVDLRAASRVGLLQGTAAAVSTSPPGTLPTLGKIRDSRFIVGGRLATKRSITWQTGLMYDLYSEKWFIRQTGFVVAVPEIHSNFWIGRTKEGPSLNRVMVGYDGWSIERFSFSDAAIPLLADGVRWQGYLPKAHLIWNLGYFLDALSKGESFSYFDHQVAGRVGFVTMQSDTAGSLFHVAVGFHNGTPADGILQLKAKPETNAAPNFVDTGKFPASAAQLLGLELYYRPGPWLMGTEYYVERAKSPETGNPIFNGGDVFVAWAMTGETRRYLTPGGVFADLSPRKSAFEGGAGAVEFILRFSNIDLDAGTLQGGQFWRLTPSMNWYLSDNVRLEFGYGYGVLHRFGTTGATQFFQSRLQLQL